MTAGKSIGVLSLQGAFIEHIHRLKQLTDATVLQVKTPEDLEKCHALIIPGGESTTISLVAQRSGLLEPLRAFCNNPNKAVWGTCAGMILLSKEATKTMRGGQELFGGMDITVNRNQYGSQIESFQADLQFNCLSTDESFNAIFIRAPILHSYDQDKGIIELASLIDNPIDGKLAPKGNVVALRQFNKMCTSFHPELTQDKRLHEYFLKEIVFKL
ncbi:SNO glutamine amidotransferase [Wallemia mellicola]|uniref:glutaminase n=1 Tax=Wallemia mellicola TaxID=1708541 RepID=A0A4T0NMS1_9BASI|nr:SNO glutamine amidotransferase [Wallemia mellicola]